MESYFNENTIEDLLDEMTYVYKSDNRPWIIGYSGGKDSTVVVTLAFKMLQNLPEAERHKPLYIVSSDTMVENPLIKQHLYETLNAMEEASKTEHLNVHVYPVKPSPSKSFWAYIIGRGYPTPKMNGKFRWCTDRLKINPTSMKMQEIIDMSDEEVVMLLGVRKAESIARKKRIEKREIMGKLLNRHEVIERAYVYNPIVELTTDDVWSVLLSYNNGITPWGVDNTNLFNLYGKADSECPFATEIKKGEQTESCGKSRFGCWVCTVIKEDKSLNGFIKSGHHELVPLAEFRRWLIDIRDIPEYRAEKRRDGIVGKGPFTWEARQMILRRLLETQRELFEEFGATEPLITLDELKAIDQIWDDELDLSRRTLVDLYYDVTGVRLPWDDYKRPLFDQETQKLLEESCKEAKLPYDLLTSLVLTTTKNKNYSNPKILRDKLNKILNQQWLHKEEIDKIDAMDTTKEIIDYDSKENNS